jgi:hypothetical protein
MVDMVVGLFNLVLYCHTFVEKRCYVHQLNIKETWDKKYMGKMSQCWGIYNYMGTERDIGHLAHF